LACAAFIRTEIHPRRDPKRWETIGLCLGAIIGIFSFAAGVLLKETLQIIVYLLTYPFLIIIHEPQTFSPFTDVVYFSQSVLFFLPAATAFFYAPILYGWAAWKALKKRKEQAAMDASIAAFVSLPFMAAAMIYAQRLYEKLPDTQPDCYVATAAIRTPKRLLSTMIDPTTGCEFSRQLLTFKAFEFAWMTYGATSHTAFRLLYNAIGPVFAFFLRLHPILASIGYFSLKPMEWAALSYLRILQKQLSTAR
jgi:hypothetical protein